MNFWFCNNLTNERQPSDVITVSDVTGSRHVDLMVQYLHFTVSLSMLTLSMDLVILYGPIYFINDYSDIKSHKC